MDRLKPFFTFYGGKWRIAQHYPQPLYERIIEPFAGSAGYALHYYWLNVVLCDIDPIICGVWDYLIHASEADILTLPSYVEHIDNLNCCQEAKWLIGFWLNKSTTRPSLSPSAWMRSGIRPNSFWSEQIRGRIASQVSQIRHWRVIQNKYDSLDNVPSTWFIDPPYLSSGKYYKYHDINYTALADWSRTRRGQVIVCEQSGANWLTFKDFRQIKTLEGSRGKSRGLEVIWEHYND